MQANHKMTVAALALSFLGLMVSGIGTGFAQNMVRVRGTIDYIDGPTYLVKARDGAELKVALADNPQIFVVKADRFADLFVSADDLRDSRLARFTPDEVQSVAIESPGKPAMKPELTRHPLLASNRICSSRSASEPGADILR